MQIHTRVGVPEDNRVVVAQGALALLAFTLMLGVAARGVQSLPNVQAQQTLAHTQQQVPTGSQQQEVTVGGNDRKATIFTGTIFTGTIVKDGTGLVLRDQSGKVYRLSRPSKAERFEGKPVRVRGRLEAAAGLLHVDSIEAASA